MNTKKIIIGNWKMYPPTLEKAKAIFQKIEDGLLKGQKVKVVVCPSFAHVASLGAMPKRKVLIGAQNVFHEPKGSFTGEVSFDILKDAGVSHVILGHNDRRKLGETDETVNKKVLLALKAGITPVVCIGENVRDEEGNYLSAVKAQIEKAFAGVEKSKLGRVITAYEPVWAIGSSEAMKAGDIHEMKIFIAKTLADIYKMKTAPDMSIIYGGSVDPLNARGILEDGQADGLMVGRQSLDPKSFLEIIASAS